MKHYKYLLFPDSGVAPLWVETAHGPLKPSSIGSSESGREQGGRLYSCAFDCLVGRLALIADGCTFLLRVASCSKDFSCPDRGHEVYGADVSSAMIETVRQRMWRRGVAEDHFRICETDSLAFPDEMFDLAVGLDVLPYVDDQPRYLRKLRRVLKRGALALFSNVNPRALYAQ